MQVGLMVLFFYFFFQIIGSIQDKQMSGGSNFEIKKAKDVEQRLDDVKGIDEIRDEIKNLIRMI